MMDMKCSVKIRSERIPTMVIKSVVDMDKKEHVVSY